MKNQFWMCTFSAVVGGLLAIGIWTHLHHPANVAEGSLPGLFGTQQDQSTALQPNLTQSDYTAEELINIRVYEKVNRSVVNIDTKAIRSDDWFMMAVPMEGSGSGWVLDKQGHIVTNNHVIEGSDSIQVTLSDGSAYSARLVGTDPGTDIALLKIDAPAESLFPIELGDSSNLRVGQRAFAIGNPYGLERTMTVGIISSLNRTIGGREGRRLKNMIQLDAALNQGNSGGPLLDTQGRLIGMNTAIATLTGQNSGVGFAIPTNVIKRTVPELVQFGKVVRASLGIEAIMEMRKGVLIAKTERNGAAEQAGLRGAYRIQVERMGNMQVRRQFFDRENADVILRIDDREIHNADDINNALDEKKPGDQIVVTFLRNGRQQQITVELGSE